MYAPARSVSTTSRSSRDSPTRRLPTLLLLPAALVPGTHRETGRRGTPSRTFVFSQSSAPARRPHHAARVLSHLEEAEQRRGEQGVRRERHEEQDHEELPAAPAPHREEVHEVERLDRPAPRGRPEEAAAFRRQRVPGRMRRVRLGRVPAAARLHPRVAVARERLGRVAGERARGEGQPLADRAPQRVPFHGNAHGGGAPAGVPGGPSGPTHPLSPPSGRAPGHATAQPTVLARATSILSIFVDKRR